MSRAEDYVRMIRELADHAALMALWQRLLRNEPMPDWGKGKPFEYLLLRAFEIEGAEVTWPYEVRIEEEVVEQIDGAVHLANMSALIEAKDHEQQINLKPILELKSRLDRRPPAVVGIVFSKRDFTPPALILAKYQTPQRVMLWRGGELTVALARRGMCSGLMAKHRHLIEHGLPDYNLAMEGTR